MDARVMIYRLQLNTIKLKSVGSSAIQ